MGNNGNPSDAFLPRRCEGDRDNDKDWRYETLFCVLVFVHRVLAILFVAHNTAFYSSYALFRGILSASRVTTI